jgi:hypothetical protein
MKRKKECIHIHTFPILYISPFFRLEIAPAGTPIIFASCYQVASEKSGHWLRDGALKALLDRLGYAR